MSSTVADRKPGRLRVQLRELWLDVGYPGGHCYSVHLEPEIAIQLAHGLTEAALRAQRAGHEAVAELDAITRVPHA